MEDNSSNQYSYLGNCSNIFDDDGNCYFSYFNDVSDFANYAEKAEDEMDIEEREGNGSLDKNEFYSLVKDSVPDFVRKIKDLNYYYYSNGLLVAYDPNEDIHYFFGKHL